MNRSIRRVFLLSIAVGFAVLYGGQSRTPSYDAPVTMSLPARMSGSAYRDISPDDRGFVPEVSLDQLIEAPNRYDSEVIRVRGHIRLRENDMYLEKANAEVFVPADCIWIPERDQVSVDVRDRDYVEVKGYFDLKKGPDAFAGTLRNIWQITDRYPGR